MTHHHRSQRHSNVMCNPDAGVVESGAQARVRSSLQSDLDADPHSVLDSYGAVLGEAGGGVDESEVDHREALPGHGVTALQGL